ncbi:histone deacetylase [Haliscomenobacter hydrossis]|uniref:Histone deacetylase n=1 Tax=Haliscomenobacter hydrossis (strain ATCC 27775 / DSM 1100 / LMG 10767 / O) TaxID=760192 RepID=F4KV14_HALH1|nr:histone deacetylase [Haliscomenobacter hydrossis]AEE49180.1 Histone deacetylase [Haliscomenobacter hydrossis DSM 1100]
MLKIAYDPIYKYKLPEGHRFPMIKYELIPEQLLYEGTVSAENFFNPGPLDEASILLTHTLEYWQRLRDQQLTEREIRAIGFPLTTQLVERSRTIANGTLQCAFYAQQYGVAMNVAGGTHHAYAFRGEGFCCTNDIAVAANYLLHHQLLKKILVIDLDVHQGNGTAHIFRNDPRVFTFSMHGAKNYPLRKEVSDLDIGLPDKTDDRTYLRILKKTLPELLENVQPELVFYLSGVDVLESDKLGRLSLSPAGCRERDWFVLKTCKENDLPVAVSMGGGYSESLALIVEAHANTYRVAQELFF